MTSAGRSGCLDMLPQRGPAVPGSPAILSSDGQMSYETMWQQVRTTAAAIERLGTGPGDHVALLFSRSADYVTSLIAVLSTGAVAVPIDSDYPPARIAHMTAAARPAVILHHGGGADPPAISRRCRCVDVRELYSAGPDSCREDDARQPRAGGGRGGSKPIRAEDPAVILFTSGSTGEPKGVILAHRGIANRLLWAHEYYGFGGDDRVLHKASIAFDASLHEIFAPLIAGGTLVIAPPGLQFDSRGLVRLIEDEGVTTAHFVPSILRHVIDEPDLEYVNLRRVFCGGEALDMDIVRRLQEILPACKLYNQYGPTETSLSVTYWDASEPYAGSIAPIGRPISNVTLSIVKPDMSPAGVGEPGELWIGGVAVGTGYLNDDDKTRERFLQHPLSGKPGLFYRSGDVVRQSGAGYLEYLGRLDDQVKIRGVRVEPEEIGAVLRAHPLVKEAFVLAAKNNAYEIRLVAYIVPRDTPVPPGGPQSTASASEVKARARELRSYLMDVLPRAMQPDEFVFIPQLPRLPNGKVSRLALPDPPSPPADASRRETARGDITADLREIWRRELRVDEVADNDGFLALGGHSLLAMRISVAASAALGTEVSPDSCMLAESFGEWLQAVNSMIGKGVRC